MYMTLVSEETAVDSLMKIKRFGLEMETLCVFCHVGFSGQSFWLQIQRSRVRFPALPDFLSSSGSVTGSTQPRKVN